MTMNVKPITCKNGRPNPQPAECQEHYGCIYENNHLNTLLVDPENGRIVDANRSACSFYGYSLSDLRKLSIADLMGNVSDAIGSFLRNAAPEAEASLNRVFTDRHQLASGTEVDVEIHTGIISMLGKTCIYSVVHDISERAHAERRLKESEERYRDLVELCPEAIIVIRKGVLLFANKQSEFLFGRSKEELVGQEIRAFFEEATDDRKADASRVRVKDSRQFRMEKRMRRHDGRLFDVELAGARIRYQDRSALQLVLRDITESRRELERAVRLQEHRYSAPFPLADKASFEKLYVPSKTLSGDFFLFHKLNEDEVIGVLGDVTGKGIAAALNISAIRVLISNGLLLTQEPARLLTELNRMAMEHLDEEYLSACCFHFDFRTGCLRASGAGINEFLYSPASAKEERVTIKGAPLGMFAESCYEERLISFAPGDRFFFFSDGMELLFHNEELCGTAAQLEKKMAHQVLQDDCTWLGFQIIGPERRE
ncbi:PAS domain S-box protein [Gorillibacterium sp. CAU 1737]|uniref:SpoIIE family protein phosphatase n=1 Tax=Gorillibacterium sp. CAU 1737 TaxID=3140362 RepID=UPI003261C524